MNLSRYKILAIAIVTFLLIASAGYAGEFSKVGTAGAQFLKIGMGARYIGMGEASSAVVDDAYSMYWNPAGMAVMEETEFAFTSVDWIEDVSLNFISFVRPMGFGGTLGLSATILGIGEMEETTVFEPNGTGNTFDASSFSISAGYARSLTDRFSAGIKMKYVSERIAQARSRGIAFDIGTLFKTGYKNLRVGLNISNLGQGLKFSGSDLNFKYSRDPDNANYDPINASYLTEEYDLPLTFRIGCAYDLVETSMSTWTIAAEAKHPNDNVQQLSLGSEYLWNSMVAMRAGYKFKYEEEGLTLGAGVILSPTQSSALVIDYAWSDFGSLDSVHRFSFGIRF
ncbi:MAG: PorV/PorQ family protein [candidate division Zixibacteria bacterium]|nr:PorV/PorQ family protein [candidate division Zixibacteria bacterium]MBU1471068.1 PorV/PorQ family protein [candidate division Zixibacteria bacterium]MBU2626726.1 PorV/PorQ family protein [candidate division Zixibacteria bacterium]